MEVILMDLDMLDCEVQYWYRYRFVTPNICVAY